MVFYNSVSLLSKDVIKFMFCEKVKAVEEWPLLSSVELQANSIAKILTLSDADMITTWPFMMESAGNLPLPLLRYLFVILQNPCKPSFFLFSALAWTACA